jgi:hypothetical protein
MICGMTPALLVKNFAQVRVDVVEFGGVVATTLGTKAAVFLRGRRMVSYETTMPRSARSGPAG